MAIETGFKRRRLVPVLTPASLGDDEEGLIAFDVFPALLTELLNRLPLLANAYANAHPLIIVDEFQDTNSDEWAMIEQLARHSRIIALVRRDPRSRRSWNSCAQRTPDPRRAEQGGVRKTGRRADGLTADRKLDRRATIDELVSVSLAAQMKRRSCRAFAGTPLQGCSASTRQIFSVSVVTASRLLA
jgi:hypothetical protein